MRSVLTSASIRPPSPNHALWYASFCWIRGCGTNVLQEVHVHLPCFKRECQGIPSRACELLKSRSTTKRSLKHAAHLSGNRARVCCVYLPEGVAGRPDGLDNDNHLQNDGRHVTCAFNSSRLMCAWGPCRDRCTATLLHLGDSSKPDLSR